MKFKNIYKVLAILVLFVTLQSRSNGPGNVANLQVTGAPGSTGNNGTCANTGCHTSGSFNPTHNMQLLDGTDVVDGYEAGKSYTLKISIEASSGTPSRYGFQAVSLDESDGQIGSWGSLGAGKQTTTLSNRIYAEHSSPSNSGTFELEWIAPDSGAGDVTFYSAGLASNNNGGTTGDGMANSMLTLSEVIIDNVQSLEENEATLKIFPNPVHETLNLEINTLAAGNFNIHVLDILGRLVKEVPVSVQVGQQVENIDVSHLQPGMYVVQLVGEEHLTAIQMLKN